MLAARLIACELLAAAGLVAGELLAAAGLVVLPDLMAAGLTPPAPRYDALPALPYRPFTRSPAGSNGGRRCAVASYSSPPTFTWYWPALATSGVTAPPSGLRTYARP